MSYSPSWPNFAASMQYSKDDFDCWDSWKHAFPPAFDHCLATLILLSLWIVTSISFPNPDSASSGPHYQRFRRPNGASLGRQSIRYTHTRSLSHSSKPSRTCIEASLYSVVFFAKATAPLTKLSGFPRKPNMNDSQKIFNIKSAFFKRTFFINYLILFPTVRQGKVTFSFWMIHLSLLVYP